MLDDDRIIEDIPTATKRVKVYLIRRTYYTYVEAVGAHMLMGIYEFLMRQSILWEWERIGSFAV